MLALCGATLTVIDAERHRLPDRLVLVAASSEPPCGLAGAAVRPGGTGRELRRIRRGRRRRSARCFFAVAPSSPRSLGLGDVKLGGGARWRYLGWFGWTCVLGGVALRVRCWAPHFALGVGVASGARPGAARCPSVPSLLLGTLAALADPGLLAGGPVPGG